MRGGESVIWRLMKFPRVLIALLAVCGLWTGCSSIPPGPPTVLRVGVTPNYPPIIYKSGGKIVGVEAEFAHALANRMGRRVEFVEMPFDRLLPALNAGKIDIIMSGMSVTALRTPLAQFCMPYAVTGQALLVRSADVWTYSYPDVIYVLKTRIGVEKGTIAELLARQRCPNATVTSFSSVQAAVRGLKAGNVDVVLTDAPLVWRIAAEKSSQGISGVRRLLTREDLAWAVRRGDTEMLAAGNAALLQWRQDGTLARILQDYSPLAQ